MLIIASVGLHDTEEKTRKVLLTGADILRFNFSRRTPEENINFIKVAIETIESLNTGVKIMVDMPLNKIRLGDFNIKNFAVREKEDFICKSASFTLDCNEFIPINTSKLGEKVKLNQIVTIGDGEIAVQVIKILDSDTIKIKILNNGIIQYMTTFNLPPNGDVVKLINKYKEIFEKTLEIKPNYFAISYLNKETNEKIKKMDELQKHLNRARMLIKIENKNAIDNLEQIFQDPFYDMVLLDRGELGVNIPFEKLAIVQKYATRLSKKYNKPLIVSSQILESTTNNFIPCRAEILSLSEMVMDGVAGIMFCRETGYNTRPAYSISVAKKIIEEAQKYLKSK